MRKEQKRDLITGIVFFGIAVFIFLASFHIKILVVSRIGSAFVPQLASTLLGLLSLLLVVQSLGKTAYAGETSSPPPLKGRAAFSVIATFALIFFYLFLLEAVGFLITTAVYLFAQFWVLSKKKPNLPLYALIAVLSSAIIYYTFVEVFVLMLPSGILG